MTGRPRCAKALGKLVGKRGLARRVDAVDRYTQRMYPLDPEHAI